MRPFIAWMAFAMLPLGSAFAQTQLPNLGFENWQGIGSNTEEPTNWNSNETGGGYATWGPQTCFRSTSAYTGTYSAEMRTLTYAFNAVNGSITTGKIQAPSTNPSQGYIETVRNDANYNAPFVGRPDSLVGYYKYTKAGSDRAKIEVILHGDYNVRTPLDAGSTPYVIGTASFLGPQATVSTWTRFSVPFTYASGATPMYALAVATSSSTQGSAVDGSKLWLDDLQVVYNPTIALNSINPAAPYYVSAADGAAVSVAYTAVGNYNAGNTFTLQLSDAAGSFAAPVVLGSVAATNSGTISGTIPAGTVTGSGYRMRIVSSNPAVTSADNGTNLQINLCNTSVAPATAQTIGAGANGAPLTVTENVAAASREWKFATVSGGAYGSFDIAETGLSYTPSFAVAGSYYVVCVSTFPGGLALTSNETVIHIVSNAITPSSSQSILVSTNGTALTVAETPAGTAREWKFATVSGGAYSAFAPAQTGMTYTPNFASIGNYFVICQSTINGVSVTSNEVQISVGNVTIATGAVNGSPFQFSASAPNAAVAVPFTASAALNMGNTFTAQLSDATGSFAAPTNIGTLSGTTSGTINATIPAATLDGDHYRIRVISSAPVVNGSDNGVDLEVDQFANDVTPASVQNTTAGIAGNMLTVAESQTAVSRAWRMSTVSGGSYTGFTPAETGTNYTPLFQSAGTYYVVCASTNQHGDEVLSNEIEIVVAGGTDLLTTGVTNSPYLISPSSLVQAVVDFTSNAVYNNGNVFTVQLSDLNGSFANPINVGSLTATTPASILATIPNNSISGTGYRMRVVSSDPVLFGTDNGVDLTVVQFETSVVPVDTQDIYINQNGAVLLVNTTHSATHEWKYRSTPLVPFASFSPAETASTYTPFFTYADVFYIVCVSQNTWGDVIQSGEVVILVTENTGVLTLPSSFARIYWSGNQLVVDAQQANFSTDVQLRLLNTAGQVLLQHTMTTNSQQVIPTNLPVGNYLIHLTDGEKQYTIQTVKMQE